MFLCVDITRRNMLNYGRNYKQRNLLYYHVKKKSNVKNKSIILIYKRRNNVNLVYKQRNLLYFYVKKNGLAKLVQNSTKFAIFHRFRLFESAL